MKYELKSMKVDAVPMTKSAYCELRGWDIPFDEDPEEYGMYVTFPHHNHTTWVRQHVFEATYAKVEEGTYITRLADELVQTSERLEKLTAFLDQQGKLPKPTLPQDDLADLFLQQTLMTELVKVLTKRLNKAKAQLV